MAELKTKKTNASVKAFIDAVENETRRKDARAIAKLMREVTGKRAKLWGSSIIGYGSYKYEYDSGQSGEWPLVGFSPRKANLVLYIMPGFSGSAPLMKKLGKHKTGKSCLYINKLEDVDMDVLRELVEGAVEHMKRKYETS